MELTVNRIFIFNRHLHMYYEDREVTVLRPRLYCMYIHHYELCTYITRNDFNKSRLQAKRIIAADYVLKLDSAISNNVRNELQKL
jgi:hypothetical protein